MKKKCFQKYDFTKNKIIGSITNSTRTYLAEVAGGHISGTSLDRYKKEWKHFLEQVSYVPTNAQRLALVLDPPFNYFQISLIQDFLVSKQDIDYD